LSEAKSERVDRTFWFLAII